MSLQENIINQVLECPEKYYQDNNIIEKIRLNIKYFDCSSPSLTNYNHVFSYILQIYHHLNEGRIKKAQESYDYFFSLLCKKKRIPRLHNLIDFFKEFQGIQPREAFLNFKVGLEIKEEEEESINQNSHNLLNYTDLENNPYYYFSKEFLYKKITSLLPFFDSKKLILNIFKTYPNLEGLNSEPHKEFIKEFIQFLSLQRKSNSTLPLSVKSFHHNDISQKNYLKIYELKKELQKDDFTDNPLNILYEIAKEYKKSNNTHYYNQIFDYLILKNPQKYKKLK